MKIFYCKTLINKKIMIFFNLVLANFVPAAAVKREGQVLFEFIGHKELLGCKLLYYILIINQKFNFNSISKIIY